MGEPDRAQREKGSGGAGGEKKRDRCREEEIRPRGQSIGREGALGRTAAGTMSTGRRAERRRRWGGDRQREQRAEETETTRDREQGGPPPGSAEEGSKRGEALLRGIPGRLSSDGGMQMCSSSTCCPGQAPGPCSHATACQPHTTWLCSQRHLNPGPDMKGHGLGASRSLAPRVPPSSPHRLPKSSLPASQQSQQLSNGAVWIQALILHRARPEAPTQRSCPHWRLPAKGPASCPAPTSLGRKPRDPLPRGWPRQRP